MNFGRVNFLGKPKKVSLMAVGGRPSPGLRKLIWSYLASPQFSQKRIDGLHPILLGLVFLAFVKMAWLSVARYDSYNLSSFDLGNMSQAIWSATQGQPLIFTTEGFLWSRLALHVELFYFLLAPIYALFPSPVTLLIIQAALYACGAFPAYFLAKRHLANVRAALLIATIYLLYPVAQTAVLFQFHGDTLAMPFLMFAIDALDRRAWRTYGVWVVLALSCKFYAALPLLPLGFLLWLQGERRAGLATAVGGLLWGVLAFWVIRPLFSPAEAGLATADTVSYFTYYFGQVDQFRDTFGLRVANGLIVCAPALILGWRAPGWWLPALAIIIPTLLSSGPGPSYGYNYHHYALAVPFLIAAIIYGAANLRQRQLLRPESQRNSGLGYVFMSFLVTLMFNVGFVNTPLSPLFYLPFPGITSGADLYRVSGRDTFKDTWLAEVVPAHVAIAADDLLGSRLVNRHQLYRTQPQFKSFNDVLPAAEYVVVDALYDFPPGYAEVNREHETIRLLLEDAAFRLFESRDGLLMFGRGESGLEQQVDILPAATPPLLHGRFGDDIGLVESHIVPLGENRFRVTFDWVALRPLDELSPRLAVSRVPDVAHTRFVHLPVLALRPTTTWQPEQIIRETFEIVLPTGLATGSYPLWVGWYNSGLPFAAQTDGRSRVGDEIQVGFLEVR